MPVENKHSIVGQDMKQEPVSGTTGPGANNNRYKPEEKTGLSFGEKALLTFCAAGIAVAGTVAIYKGMADKSNIRPGQTYELSGFDKGAHLVGEEQAPGTDSQLTEDNNGDVKVTPEEEIDQILGVAQVTQNYDGGYHIEYQKDDLTLSITTDPEDNSQSVTVENPLSGNVFQFEVENGEVTSSHNLGAIGQNFLNDGVGKVSQVAALVEEYDNDAGSDGLTGDYNKEVRRKLSSLADKLTKAGGEDLEGITADGVDIKYTHYGEKSKSLAVMDMHITLPNKTVAGGKSSFSMDYNYDIGEDNLGIKQITVTNSFADKNGTESTNTFVVADGQILSSLKDGEIGVDLDDSLKNVIVYNSELVVGAITREGGADITESLSTLRDFTKTGTQHKAETQEKVSDILILKQLEKTR